MATTFDFKKVAAIADGQFLVGFMDGTPIQAEKNEDNVTPHIGAAGDVTFTEGNNETGTITITLKQNSSSLPHLIKLAKSKKTFPVQIVDANDSRVRAGGTEARIIKTPSVEWGSEISGVEVQFYIADFDITTN